MIAPSKPPTPKSTGSEGFRRRRPQPVEFTPRQTSSSSSPTWHRLRSQPLLAAAMAVTKGDGGVAAAETPSPEEMKHADDASQATTTPPSSADSRGSSSSSSASCRSLSMTAARPTLLRQNSISFRGLTEDAEKCGCSTKEEFWPACDVFEAMDRRNFGSISRADYTWALSGLGTSLEFQRVAGRARLAAYFKATAQDLSLEDCIRRMYPMATDQDMGRMKQWANLRKAHNLIFKGSGELSISDRISQAFCHLDAEGSSQVPVTQLIRARLLSRKDAAAALPGDVASMRLCLQEFCAIMEAAIRENLPESAEVGSDKRPSEWTSSFRKRFSQARLLHETLESSLEPSDTTGESSRVAEDTDGQVLENTRYHHANPVPPSEPPSSPPRPKNLLRRQMLRKDATAVHVRASELYAGFQGTKR